MSDEALLRYLDGEVTGEMRRNVRGHLRRCPECLRRAKEIRELTVGLERELVRLDRDPPPALLPRTFREVQLRRGGAAVRRGSPALRRAAAVLLLLGGGAFLVSPLSARVADWVGDRIRDAARAAGFVSDRAASAPAPTAPADEEGDPSEFSFVPEGTQLRLEFASGQAGGTLHVSTTGERSASFRVLGSQGAAVPVLMLPSEIRVRNTADTTSSYRLTIPGTVELVRVIVSGRAPVEIRPASLPSGTEYPVPLQDAPLPARTPPAPRPPS